MVDAKDAGILKSPIKVVVAKFVSMSDKNIHESMLKLSKPHKQPPSFPQPFL